MYGHLDYNGQAISKFPKCLLNNSQSANNVFINKHLKSSVHEFPNNKTVDFIHLTTDIKFCLDKLFVLCWFSFSTFKLRSPDKQQEPPDVGYCCFLIPIMRVGKYKEMGENTHFRQRDGSSAASAAFFILLDDLGFGKLNISKIRMTWENDLIIIRIIPTTYCTARCRSH